jgi:tRNA 2-(methylsulfanyl)-N6-isopentenyladenosine37 hydroxylase
MSDQHNNILGLTLPTDPRWVNLAEISMEYILTDHAYCEQKAASTGISMIQRYPSYTRLVQEMSPIVTEEWGHFRLVLAELTKRGYTLGRQRKDEYVSALMDRITKGGAELPVLLDRLLVFALIEARSCERFRLLAEGLTDARMQKFYTKFMISEAGHYRTFLDLAKEYVPKPQVDERWKWWLQQEVEILGGLQVRGDRMH